MAFHLRTQIQSRPQHFFPQADITFSAQPGSEDDKPRQQAIK